MTVSLEATLSAVQGFVAGIGGDGKAIDAKTQLLSDGHLDSFSLVELIQTLESKLSITLEDGALIPEDFESVETLHARLTDVLS